MFVMRFFAALCSARAVWQAPAFVIVTAAGRAHNHSCRVRAIIALVGDRTVVFVREYMEFAQLINGELVGGEATPEVVNPGQRTRFCPLLGCKQTTARC
jgi:hypothetical protein